MEELAFLTPGLLLLGHPFGPRGSSGAIQPIPFPSCYNKMLQTSCPSQELPVPFGVFHSS